MRFIDAGSSGEWGWHATEVAMRCPRMFAYLYRSGSGGGREEADRPALLRGSLVHQGLAHLYVRRKAQQEGTDPNEWAPEDVAIEDCARKLGRFASQYVAGAQEAVRQYAAHWSSERLEVLNVEEVFASEIGKYRFTQRFDLVCREPDGKVWIYDHKTTGRITKGIGERYTLSGQFIGMANFGARIWGPEFGGVKLNLIELPDENKRASFSRQVPDPAPAAMKAFTFTVLHARERIDRLDEALKPEDWPMAISEQTCITAYGRCEFFERCRWGI